LTNVQMTDDEFRLFRDFIHKECGLYFGNGKKSFLSSRIAKCVESASMRSFYRYYRYLQGNGSDQKAELMRLLDTLTINETGFFRNRPQFELLENLVLPEITKEKKTSHDTRLRIWSAGCSTGEEPYSIAISVLESLAFRHDWDINIFASDLALSVLETAARGVYPSHRLEGLESSRLRRYFEPCSEGYIVREEVKRHVIYDFHNLKHENGLRQLDIIFCRNVLIYFDPEEQQNVLGKFIDALQPGGFLFLGHSESVLGLTDELQFVHRNKGTAYRKVSTP
jgi:chemotaxis protein methyltransferase CheR